MEELQTSPDRFHNGRGLGYLCVCSCGMSSSHQIHEALLAFTRWCGRKIIFMRIAQVAPLYESVPPKLYGGTERVVSWLTEELVALGHDVTLFASGDSMTSAKLEAIWPRALRLDGSVRDPVALHMLMMERVRERAMAFDLMHFH